MIISDLARIIKMPNHQEIENSNCDNAIDIMARLQESKIGCAV